MNLYRNPVVGLAGAGEHLCGWVITRPQHHQGGVIPLYERLITSGTRFPDARIAWVFDQSPHTAAPAM